MSELALVTSEEKVDAVMEAMRELVKEEYDPYSTVFTLGVSFAQGLAELSEKDRNDLLEDFFGRLRRVQRLKCARRRGTSGTYSVRSTCDTKDAEFVIAMEDDIAMKNGCDDLEDQIALNDAVLNLLDAYTVNQVVSALGIVFVQGLADLSENRCFVAYRNIALEEFFRRLGKYGVCDVEESELPCTISLIWGKTETAAA
jgi:hypothetical protein